MKDAVASNGAVFVLADDIPVICSFRNLARVNVSKNSCVIDYVESIDDRMPLTDLYQSILESKVLYVDPHEALCSESNCEFFRGGIPIYADTSPHIANSNKNILSSVFKSLVESER